MGLVINQMSFQLLVVDMGGIFSILQQQENLGLHLEKVDLEQISLVLLLIQEILKNLSTYH